MCVYLTVWNPRAVSHYFSERPDWRYAKDCGEVGHLRPRSVTVRLAVTFGRRQLKGPRELSEHRDFLIRRNITRRNL